MKYPSREALAYAALATQLQGDYRKITKAYQQYGGWEIAGNDTKFAGERTEPEAIGEALVRQGLQIMLRDDPAYPPLLHETAWPPHALFVKGPLPDGKRPGIAIVGTRRATLQGKETAHAFAEKLARAGLPIISGLAVGIDGAAHRGALEAGGTTVAVLAGGLDRVYPRHHESLARQIFDRGGALVSEYAPGAEPLPYRFLERNRIVAGLAAGTLVVEAPRESGALATARFALEANRAVFVVPGPVNHPNFAGSHDLIRDGAELVADPAHILESLGVQAARELLPTAELDETEEKIFRALLSSARSLDMDAVIAATGLNAQTANRAVTTLLLKRRIMEQGAGYVVA